MVTFGFYSKSRGLGRVGVIDYLRFLHIEMKLGFSRVSRAFKCPPEMNKLFRLNLKTPCEANPTIATELREYIGPTFLKAPLFPRTQNRSFSGSGFITDALRVTNGPFSYVKSIVMESSSPHLPLSRWWYRNAVTHCGIPKSCNAWSMRCEPRSDNTAAPVPACVRHVFSQPGRGSGACQSKCDSNSAIWPRSTAATFF